MALSALSSSYNNDDWIYRQLVGEDFCVADSITDLTDHAWIVFSSTPICNLSSSTNVLVKLEESLNNALQNAGLDCNMLSFNIKPFLAFVDEDHDAIEISLSVKQGTKKSQNYYGLFISRGTVNKKNKHFVRLSVLMCRGQVKLIKSINSILENLFDISISPTIFTVKELLSVGLVTILHGNFNGSSTCKLKYVYPDVQDATITYEISLENLKEFWLSLTKSVSTTSGTEVFNLFYTEIQKHFCRVYGIDLSFFQLKSVLIENENCGITSDGKIKNKIPETFDFLLKYLTKRFDQEYKVL
ncbi:uncharacterized protein LOC142321442 [Lycorma delicatula]|uniref:uncharacterized protein LOC142321442 n=1 Tax=Lycorma delicatula TaxID=130591 RepID=UPI003F515A0B